MPEKRDPAVGYAMHFVNNTSEEPTDEQIREVLKHSALRPPVRLYPDIRAQVLAWRNRETA